MLLPEEWEVMDLGSKARLGSGPADNAPLNCLIWQETFAEIVALLAGDELLVAYLRSQGLSDDEIGLWLGRDPATVARSIGRARRRIERQAPHLASVLAGRRRCSPSQMAGPERRMRDDGE